MSDELVHVFHATGLSPSDGTAQAEEDERIEVVRWPLADLDGAIAATATPRRWWRCCGSRRAARVPPHVQHHSRRGPRGPGGARRRGAGTGPHAPGQVFAPNPVADLGIQTLTDQKDADYFTPFYPQAYHRVTLTDLDGSGTLTGAYAKVLSATGKARGTPAPGSSSRATRTSSSRRWPTTG